MSTYAKPGLQPTTQPDPLLRFLFQEQERLGISNGRLARMSGVSSRCINWSTLADELVAWSYIRRWLKLAKRIGGQNFLYDTHWLWRKYGLAIPHSAFDTMLMHHAMQPELEKGLGFLGTIYTDELGWKFMRAKHETLKKED